MLYNESKTQTLMFSLHTAPPGTRLPRVAEGAKDAAGKIQPPSPDAIAAFWAAIAAYPNVGDTRTTLKQVMTGPGQQQILDLAAPNAGALIVRVLGGVGWARAAPRGRPRGSGSPPLPPHPPPLRSTA